MFADVKILDFDYSFVGGLLLLRACSGLARTFSEYIYNVSFIDEESFFCPCRLSKTTWRKEFSSTGRLNPLAISI